MALFVFFSTIPVVLPFVYMHYVALAMRVSKGIAMGLRFFAGYRLGQMSGRRPWLQGVVNVAGGAGMVSLCIALGGLARN
jgi:VIT1/CCC1 family predicted Fe2+/Mn2+ transporter